MLRSYEISNDLYKQQRSNLFDETTYWDADTYLCHHSL